MDNHAEGLNSPPLEPVGPIETNDDTDFTEKCVALVKTFDVAENWQLGRPAIERNEKWGLVWRADFSILDSKPQFRVNRIVCWETQDKKMAIEIAIGQDLTPLPAAS